MHLWEMLIRGKQRVTFIVRKEDIDEVFDIEIRGY